MSLTVSSSRLSLKYELQAGALGEVRMGRSVDNLSLERWRALDALMGLEKLGCYLKVAHTFEALTAYKTRRYKANAEGQDFELLLQSPKFYDTQRQRGGGGAVDFVMHIGRLDFKGATALLRRLAV